MFTRIPLRHLLLVTLLTLTTVSPGMGQRKAGEEEPLRWTASFVPTGDRVPADTDWKYTAVRRLLVFLEQSLTDGLEWTVFEPNPEPVWASVREAVEGFLSEELRNGALKGRWADEAFDVRCDRTTMTQRDIDAGRLVCRVGMAPERPGEFVVLRIEREVRQVKPDSLPLDPTPPRR